MPPWPPGPPAPAAPGRGAGRGASEGAGAFPPGVRSGREGCIVRRTAGFDGVGEGEDEGSAPPAAEAAGVGDAEGGAEDEEREVIAAILAARLGGILSPAVLPGAPRRLPCLPGAPAPVGFLPGVPAPAAGLVPAGADARDWRGGAVTLIEGGEVAAVVVVAAAASFAGCCIGVAGPAGAAVPVRASLGASGCAPGQVGELTGFGLAGDGASSTLAAACAASPDGVTVCGPGAGACCGASGCVCAVGG